MDKLRCYERNYERETRLQLARMGREERKLGTTGTEEISINEIRIRDVLKSIMTRHKNTQMDSMHKFREKRLRRLSLYRIASV